MPEDAKNIQPLVVGSRRIGPGEPVFVIAEIGINHQGSVEIAKRLIDAAVAAGADAAKFQKRSLPDLYDAELLANPNLGEQKFQYLLPLLKEFELSIAQLRELQAYCAEKGILFFATPFDVPSSDALTMLNVPLYKIGSPDLTNLPLLEHVAGKGKPILMSTGMAEESEIDISVQLLRRLDVPFGLFHVNSTYPAPFDEINLRFMDRLKEYGVPVGYSGHERGIAVALAAVGRGAAMIERHLTLDRSLEGPDHQASLLPDEFAQMVQGIRQIELAFGSGQRRMTRVEVMNREALAKSVVAARVIRTGERITRDMLAVRSPAKGLSPQRISELVGITARRGYATGERFIEADLAPVVPEATFDPRTLRIRWAPVVRFSDVERFLSWNPPALEFHLTDKDLEEPIPARSFHQELIVHAPEYRHRSLVDLATPDADARRRSVESLKRTVEKVRELAPHFPGTPKLIVHPGGYSLTPYRNPRELLQLLEDSLTWVNLSGIELLLENLPPRPWFFGGEWVQNIFLDAHEIKTFLDTHGLKMCLDTSHAQLACNAAQTSLVEFCRILRPYVRHLHLSDAEGLGEEGLQIGEGDVDWKAVLEIFRDYDGTITPEVWQGHLEGGKGFLLALKRLAPYFTPVRAAVQTWG
ncbi:MAG: sialic acid synthase [Parcubacteria group bacterium Gr01-1014_38]|nr:MAG: sialic acid synthase [Parcubacteria group bacterium Gr01-1014_38]